MHLERPLPHLALKVSPYYVHASIVPLFPWKKSERGKGKNNGGKLTTLGKENKVMREEKKAMREEKKRMREKTMRGKNVTEMKEEKNK